MHEVVPRVVAIAVRMVMTICRIFCQSSFFIKLRIKRLKVFFHVLVIQTTERRKDLGYIHRVCIRFV